MTTGLECPQCGCPETSLIKTRTMQFTLRGKLTKRRLRRRECVHCGTRFTTREETLPGSVTAPETDS